MQVDHEFFHEQIEQNQKIEHEEIKKIVNSGTVSLTGCTATALTTLILGFGLGWRNGRRSAFNKIRREQQKLLHGHKNSQRWQFLRRPLSRCRSHQESHKTAEVRPGDDIHVVILEVLYMILGWIWVEGMGCSGQLN
ncbi:hypothetical protein QJS04_geneDACA008058 [Acorus gramineus]|uniref:Uncharacterized protein n=1 Tax=Acorus gramineus TaxID=55184 RepID=A0AAV9BBT9_ACOGR|nr:hypothetical protein QJS04_geneDACA008058 [Acorus gramineus]